MRNTDSACDTVATGCVSSADHGGSRCANGEVALKLVVKVKVAREVRTPCPQN
jgi:hypothetical protein